MSEIMTAPIITLDANGDEVVTFTSAHTHADIVRWMMQNRADAESLYYLLGEELGKLNDQH